MSKNRLDKILTREIQSAKQTPSIEDVTAMFTGKDNNSIPKPVKKSTVKKRAKRNTGVGVGSKEVDTIEQIPEINHIPQIPDGFPEDTVLNDDGTLTLPDGRIIRKKQEVDHG